MSKVLYLILSVGFLISCSKPVMIGRLNSISNRNIDTKADYELVKRYAGSGKKEIKRNKEKSINAAMENLLKSTPGGEYLMNVKVYRVKRKYSVEGDVWGLPAHNDIRGFRVDDEVIFKRYGRIIKGVIIGLIDSQRCYVKYKSSDGEENEREMKFDDLLMRELVCNKSYFFFIKACLH